jgi:hypothetical protein
VYNPKYISLPNDIYSLCLVTAHSYYALLRRRDTLADDIILASPPPPDGQPCVHGGSNETADKAERLIQRQEHLDTKIKAIEQAWRSMPDKTSREFIRLNMFERVPMNYTYLPMSERTMQRRRHEFLSELAKNLYEI